MGGARLCVLCLRRPVDERWRPFCGERCRNQDLAKWVDGDYRVPADPVQGPDSDADDADTVPD